MKSGAADYDDPLTGGGELEYRVDFAAVRQLSIAELESWRSDEI
jgi:hypothetical protein